MNNIEIITEIIGKEPYSIVKLRKIGASTVMYRIPRSLVKTFQNDIITDKIYAAYILVNKSTRQFYAGRTEDVKQRSKNHDKTKDFWNEMLAVIDESQNGFNLTSVAYLEHSFYKFATEAGSYEVQNNTVPSDGGATGSYNAVFEVVNQFLNVLGYDFFIKDSDLKTEIPTKSDIKKTHIKKTDKNSTPNVSVNAGTDITDNLDSKDWRKKHAACKKIIELAGYSYDDNFTFAAYHPEKNHQAYWADVSTDYIKGNWTIALIHKKNRQIHLCKIKPNTFTLTKDLAPAEGKLRTRDKKGDTCIDLTIKIDLIYSQTKVDFNQFVEVIINY